MSTKKCKYCKTEIDKKAKICPSCKKKQSNPLKTILIVFLVLIVLAAIGSNGSKEDTEKDSVSDSKSGNIVNNSVETKTESNSSKQSKLTVEELKELCQEFDYKKVARTPDDYKGQYFKMDVKIFSASSGRMFSSYDRSYKANLPAEYGYYGDMIYLLDNRDTSDPDYIKILDDDVITVYGRFDRMVETTNMITKEKGEEVAIEILYVELISE